MVGGGVNDRQRGGNGKRRHSKGELFHPMRVGVKKSKAS